MRRFATTGIFAAAATAALVGVTSAQPEDPPRAPAGDGARQPQDPAEAKTMLERRLEDLRRREERTKEAIDRLAKGEPVADVLRDIEPSRPFGRGDGPARRPGERDDAAPERDGDRQPRPPSRLTPEDRERLAAFVRDHAPGLAKWLDHLRTSDPERADRALARMAPRIRDAENLRRTDPKRFELRVREMEGQFASMEAIRAFRAAQGMEDNDPAKATAVADNLTKLRDAIASQFDLRLESQRYDIESLRRRLQDLEADLAKKESERGEMIDAMVTKIRDNKDARGPDDGEPKRSRPPRDPD